MAEVNLVTETIEGLDGMVRGYFMSRSLGQPASAAKFPGVRQVAILPKRFDSIDAARAFIDAHAEPGGNAIAVQYGMQRWLVGAKVAVAPG